MLLGTNANLPGAAELFEAIRILGIPHVYTYTYILLLLLLYKLLLLLFIIIYYYYYLLLLFIIIIYYYYLLLLYIYVAIYHQQLQYIINNMGIEYDRMGYFSRIQWDIQRIFFLRDGEFTIVMCISWGYHGI